ncbi:MAG TPA: response regulator [Opitutaceae bacterium]|jgi:sigma-B regulation protein RsbU (phosphoserine phosphatase)|nr:response regulator [Opitutaceae bacterium]HRE08120.1 response regulator [Opitutaceae bacterium]
MKILAVEDDTSSRKILTQALVRLGHEVIEASNGEDALKFLDETDPPRVVVSDWTMPRMDGLELVRSVRARLNTDYTYFILLTARTADDSNQRESIEAGVDDFLTKPVDLTELWMRLRVAERILRFTTQVRQLEAFLPICSYCKKVRDDRNYWQQIETYINARTGSEFSHSVCPDCYNRVIAPELEKLRATLAAQGKPSGPHAKRTR